MASLENATQMLENGDLMGSSMDLFYSTGGVC